MWNPGWRLSFWPVATPLAVSCCPAPPNVRPGFKFLEADATKLASLAPCLVGHDAVIDASRFVTSNADTLIAVVKTAGVKRLLVVGGAGTLEVAPGKALMSTDDFPRRSRPQPWRARGFSKG
ncbi:MAG: NAD(P)H-binding protein [Gemmataceae bacterium]